MREPATCDLRPATLINAKCKMQKCTPVSLCPCLLVSLSPCLLVSHHPITPSPCHLVTLTPDSSPLTPTSKTHQIDQSFWGSASMQLSAHEEPQSDSAGVRAGWLRGACQAVGVTKAHPDHARGIRRPALRQALRQRLPDRVGEIGRPADLDLD